MEREDTDIDWNADRAVKLICTYKYLALWFDWHCTTMGSFHVSNYLHRLKCRVDTNISHCLGDPPLLVFTPAPMPILFAHAQ
jgi:hypothetical protein